MKDTLQYASAGAIQAAADCRNELLDSRASLPAAVNNKAPYPSNLYARGIHKLFISNECMAFLHLAQLVKTNLDDGMAFAEAMRPIRRLESYAERWAVEAQTGVLHFRTFRPIPSVFRREQRANGDFDLDQLRVLEQRRSAGTIRAAINSCRAQIAASQDVLASLERELAGIPTDLPTTIPGRRHESTQTPQTMVHA